MGYYSTKRIREIEKKINEIKISLDKKEANLNQFQCCTGCKFESFDAWSLPCCKCSRCCNDYYSKV